MSASMESGHAACLLIRKGPDKTVPYGVPCVVLAHNEAHILPDFLSHYRSLGPISFLMVDDHSTDATPDILRRQPDVTVFHPVPGSVYASDKAAWQSQLLDMHADDAWCLVSDIDEHFVYRCMERKSLRQLIRELEREGAEALVTIMVDMYADKPLHDHVYTGGGLLPAFPLFDGPASYPFGYHLWFRSRRYRQRFPSPQFRVKGGMRRRLFFDRVADASSVQRYLLDHFSHPGRPLNPKLLDRLLNYVTRRMAKRLAAGVELGKLGLLRWRKGMRLSGGAHSVNRRIVVSESMAAFLHFKFTQGTHGLRYLADRGQHANGSVYYKEILKRSDLLSRSPVCEITRMYRDSGSLAGIIR